MSSLSLPPSRTIMYLPGLPPPIAPVSCFSHPSFSRQGPRAHASSMRGGFDGPGKPGHQHHLALRGPPCSMLGYPFSVATQFAVGATVALPSPAARIGFLESHCGAQPSALGVHRDRRPSPTRPPRSTHLMSQSHMSLITWLAPTAPPVPIPLQRTAKGGGGGGGDGWR